MGQCCGTEEVNDYQSPVESKNDFAEFKPSQKVTRQCISIFSDVMFGTPDPDAKTHKILMRGPIGPQTVDYEDRKTGQQNFRNDCNDQPAVSLLTEPTAETIPNGYAVALNAVKVPAELTDPDFKAAHKAWTSAIKKQEAQATAGKNKYKAYLEQCFVNHTPPVYRKWTSYIKNEFPAVWELYQAAQEETNVAYGDLQTINEHFHDNPISRAINQNNKWSSKTQNGTKGPDSMWTSSPNVGELIMNWKNNKLSGGGSFTVSQDSAVYKEQIASGMVALQLDFLEIGAASSGSNVFDESTKYSITYQWKASSTVQVTPPPDAYDFVVLKEYRNGPIYSDYKGYVPLTGDAKSPFSNIITAMILMYGLSMKASFDAKTYKKIVKECENGFVVFGFFAIGSAQKYTKSTFNNASYSVSVTADNDPFIAGYYTDPLI